MDKDLSHGYITELVPPNFAGIGVIPIERKQVQQVPAVPVSFQLGRTYGVSKM